MRNSKVKVRAVSKSKVSCNKRSARSLKLNTKGKKHSKPPEGDNLNKAVDDIMNDPLRLSRWLALMKGVQLAQAHEDRYNLPEEELDGMKLQKFVDDYSPLIHESILEEHRGF